MHPLPTGENILFPQTTWLHVKVNRESDGGKEMAQTFFLSLCIWLHYITN